MLLSFIYSLYIIIMFIAISHGDENVDFNDHLCEEKLTESSNNTIFVCCPGYTLDKSEQCMPVCSQPCIYGYCKAPNLCGCKEGYEIKENKCVPICKQKCINGYCSEPDICVCQNGFELDAKNKTKCLPICMPKCANFSKCISLPPKPNRCECTEGYVINEKTKTCKPYCKNKCQNGLCIAPETCRCKNGYEFHHVNKTNCIPRCEPKCEKYSSCIAPNTCVCDDGYESNKMNNELVCEPICSDQIENSRCVQPPNTWACIENYQLDRRIGKCVLEYCSCNSNGYCLEHKDKCICYDGFTKNITSEQCEPQCQPLCENSNCVANNVCECLDEYHKTSVGHVCEANDLCNGHPCKNGECLITGECRCKTGYVKSLSYRGQIQCDMAQTFVGKLMAMILGIPILLTCSVFIVIYVVAKNKAHDVEEQEMILISRS